MQRTIIIILLLTSSLLWACGKKPEAESPKHQYKFRHDGMLDILDKDGKSKATFRIEIAQNQVELMQGLKYRESMEADQGMLFVFPQTDYYDFWMQDTYLPLDMIFASADESIFQIVENAKPFSEERIAPEQPNNYVLEINGGLAKKLNIIPGDRISWKKLR